MPKESDKTPLTITVGMYEVHIKEWVYIRGRYVGIDKSGARYWFSKEQIKSIGGEDDVEF